MATIYRRTRREPLPEGAEIVERKGQRFAVWTDSKGRHRARLTKDGLAIVVDLPGYEIQFFDENGKRRKESVRCGDRDTAEQIAAERERLVLLRQKGLVDPAQERFAAEGRRPLTEHLADFRAALEARGNTGQHVQETHAQALRVVERCKAAYPSDMTASAVQEALKAIRDEGRSLGTCNHYLRSVKTFARWMHRDKRTRDDALVVLEAYNADTDPRHVRRELTPEELTWLVSVTENYTRPEHKMPGPDRAMLYRLALGSGLRAKELRSLTPESFDLDSDPPALTLTAAHSKHRREDLQPIRRDLAELLRSWLAARPTGVPVFATLALKTARMLRSDLKVARRAWIAAAPAGPEQEARGRSDFLKYRNAAGEVFDFHATRHTYISGIVAGGASVKTCQELARHSTPTLTIGRYSHARLHDIQGALEALPSSTNGAATAVERQETTLRKTGTEDVPTVDATMPNNHLRRRNVGAEMGAVERRGTASTGDTRRNTSRLTGERNNPQPVPQVLALPRNGNCRQVLATAGSKPTSDGSEMHPLGESNPRSRTENPMSLATRRRGHGETSPTATLGTVTPVSDRFTPNVICILGLLGCQAPPGGGSPIRSWTCGAVIGPSSTPFLWIT